MSTTELKDAKALAADPCTPGEQLEPLITSTDTDVRRMLAAHHNATDTMLQNLAADTDPGTRAATARNSHTTHKTLTLLASDPNPDVREAVAESTTSENLLNQLMNDPDTAVIRRAAENPDTPTVTLTTAAAAHADNPDICFMIAGNTNTSSDTLRILSQSADLRVRNEVAVNTHTPDDVLAELACNPDTALSVAYNDTTTPTIAHYLALTLPSADLHHLVTNTETSIRMLRTIAANHPHLADAADHTRVTRLRRYSASLPESVRQNAHLLIDAGFPGWPTQLQRVVHALQTSSQPPNDLALTQLPTTLTAATLHHMYTHTRDRRLTALIARHRRTSGRTLAAIATDPHTVDDSVIDHIVTRHETPQATLHTLATSTDLSPDRAALIAANQQTSPATLHTLATRTDLDDSVAIRIASRADTRAATLAALAERTHNPRTHQAIAGNPNTPKTVVNTLYARYRHTSDPKEQRVVNMLLKHRLMDQATMRAVCSNPAPAPGSRAAVAANTSIPRDLIAALARSGDPRILSNLTNNRKVDSATLELIVSTLIGTARWQNWVGLAVSAHRNTNPATLQQLAGLNDSWIRARVARHPHATADVLDAVADSIAAHPPISRTQFQGTCDVFSVAANPATAAHTYTRLEQLADTIADSELATDIRNAIRDGRIAALRKAVKTLPSGQRRVAREVIRCGFPGTVTQFLSIMNSAHQRGSATRITIPTGASVGPAISR